MGLHVAALALKRDGTASPVRARMKANQSLSSYLIEDILAHEDPAILEFLLTVSVLDRLCLPLCEALADSLSGQMTARDCLNWLVNSNFLIVPLDEEGTWYRLHRLLKEAMRQRAASQYGDAQVRAWRRRAADWFEQQGMIAEGLRQAVALGDLDLAARLVESGFVEALNREDRPTIDQWLKLFPDSFIAQRPSLLVVQAVSQQMAWRLPLLKKSLDAFDALCARQPNAPTSLSLDALRGIVRVFRAQFAYSQNNMAISEACARNALEMIPESWENGRGGAIIYFAAALQAMGRFQEAAHGAVQVSATGREAKLVRPSSPDVSDRRRRQ